MFEKGSGGRTRALSDDRMKKEKGLKKGGSQLVLVVLLPS